MLESDVVNNNKTTTILVGLVTVFSVLTQELFLQSSELWSELLSWVFLFFLYRKPAKFAVTAGPLLKDDEKYTTTSSSLWIVAACIALSSCYKAELGIIKFWPIITPLLFAAQNFLFSASSYTRSDTASRMVPNARVIWSSTPAALLALCTLSFDDFAWSATSSVAAVAMLLVFIALLPKDPDGVRFIPSINNAETDFSALSWRVILFFLCGIATQAHVFGFTPVSAIYLVLAAVMKSATWFALVRMSRHVSWTVASMIGTFSLTCTRKPSLQSSDLRALSFMISSIISLAQILHSMSPQVKSRFYLWTLLLLPLVPYVMHIFATFAAEHAASQNFTFKTQHPVQDLADQAVAEFQGLMQRQSAVYAQAHQEYRRRYGREPPKGFNAWYDFAVSHRSPIIDEFDTMYKSFAPLWALSGQEVLDIMTDLYKTTRAEVWQCNFSAASRTVMCSHPHRKNDRYIAALFTALLGDEHVTLPDVTFLVNHFDEPRVLFPNTQSDDLDVGQQKLFNLTTLSHQRTWEALSKHCAAERREGLQMVKSENNTYGLPFVTDIRSEKNICQHPEYSDKHGVFASPTSFRLVEGFVPILSTGSISTMGDILYPSPAYMEAEFKYNETHDREWQKKWNNLYWSGSTSGGYAKDDGWRWYHRQRFVELAQNLVIRQIRYLRESYGVVHQIESTFLNIRRYDVAFTQIFQCERTYCRDESSFFTMQSWSDRDQALHSRLVFDIDGNGISGRFYKLLASRSVPLKQTLFDEWHDDRLIPWVHYIPVSQSMEELPELVAYLTSNPRGQRIASNIAEQGRHWFSTAFREIDRTIYLYRLMLELASLQDPYRPRGG